MPIKLNPYQKHLIFVTQGDPAGIGWQLLFKIIRNPSKYLNLSERKNLSQLVVVGDNIIEESLMLKKFFEVLPFPDPDEREDKIFKLLNQNFSKPIFLKCKDLNHCLGRPSKKTGYRSHEYIKRTVKLWKIFPHSALLTLPVSKEWILKSGVFFTGHTELLQEAFLCKTFMCMYHPSLSVIPLTNHIPLVEVAYKIKKVDYSLLKKGMKFYANLFNVKKPMAFIGLNPHAGEGGKIGKEEFFLKKKLSFLQKDLNVHGILSPDAAFTSELRKKYSMMIACYHDQGLIPFKALYGMEGINITLNLPKLRVSPDHGPAYSLSGIKDANIKSIQNSIRFAIKWSKKWIKHYSYQP